MRISDWSSDVCSSDLRRRGRPRRPRPRNPARLPPCWRLGRAQLSRAPRGAAARRMIETERLVMRSWRDEDIAPFQRICSDPEVMATLGPPLDLDAAAARNGWMREHEAEHGHCFWALERREVARLIGDRSAEHTSELPSLMSISYAV